jgi:hypothetical protein
MSKIRSTDEIYDDIITAHTRDPLNPDYAELGRLWREMNRVAGKEKAPGWAVLAAALMADECDRKAARTS